MSDDDWFEQALRDEGEDADDATTERASATDDEESDDRKRSDADGEATTADTEAGADAERPVDADPTVEAGSDGRVSGFDGPEPDTDKAGEKEPDTDEAGEKEPDTDEAGAGTIEADTADIDEGADSEPASGSAEEDPFGQDFATALENAPDPGTDRPSGVGVGSDDHSSTGAEPDDDFGFDDFAGEGESGGEAFGFGGGEESFDEESFDSDLERLDVGIDGLDDMILGGVPRRSLMVTVGSAGTGKTTFGLQFLNHGLENGESAVYITLEESYDRILDTAGEKGWDFEGYVDEDRLAVVDIDPIEMANSLDSIQNDLPDLIEEFGADRLVLDSVSLLEMMYESAPKRRSQVFGFTRALKNAGITTLLTSEASEDNPYTSRFGIVEYLADAVFVLQYVRESDFRETRLAIEIQKIRDANHSRATKPYELTDSGISVYRQANIF